MCSDQKLSAYKKQEETTPVFAEKARETTSSISFASDHHVNYSSGLLGEYQKKNANTTVKAIQALNLELVREDHITNGLKNVVSNTGFKGRWQILQENPKVICDTAHNKEGLTYVMRQLLQEDFEKLHIVLGVVNDKKLDDVLSFFPKSATYYFCKPNIPRGLNEEELRETKI